MSWENDAVSILRSNVPVGSKLLVAVSGGPDSVALLHLLKASPYRVVVGHVDHQLRMQSRADAQFVRRLARQLDVPCLVKKVTVRAYARRQGMGLEEGARELRYQALLGMARASRASVVVTAHTANDQEETVLMNFLRGAGPAGLAGMPSARALAPGSGCLLVRPLLGVSKQDIYRYLRIHSLAYRNDATNRSLRFARNRIRHATLPYLENRHPGLGERLTQTASIFRAEEDFWRERVIPEVRKTAHRKGPSYTVVLARLLGYHKALSRRILRHILPGSTFQDIEQVLALAQARKETAWLELSRARVRRNKTTLTIIKRGTDE